MRWLLLSVVVFIVGMVAGTVALVVRALSPPPPAPVYVLPEPPDPLDERNWRLLKDFGTVLIMVVAVVLLVAVAVAVAAWLRRLWLVSDLVPTDSAGRWPVERSALVDPNFALVSVGAYHRTQHRLAESAQQVPHTFHITGQQPYYPELAEPEEEEPGVAVVPTFAELLDKGQLGAGQPLLLGYTDDGPKTGDWKALYSAAVAGLSGAGKTTTLRFLAGQSVLHGARFLILDPHMEAGEDSLADTLAPLRSRFLAAPAQDAQGMLVLLSMATHILEERLHGAPKPWPLIIAVDEFTGLMGRSDLAGPLARLIEQIAQEGRKVGVFALVSGQIFTAARAGGSALRDAFASAYVHRMKRNQARLILPADMARIAETLPTGSALLYQTSGEIELVRIPLTTGADMQAIGRLLEPGVIVEGQVVSEVAIPSYQPPATVEEPLATAEERGRLEATGADALENELPEAQETSRLVAGDPAMAKALEYFDAGMGLPDAIALAYAVNKKAPNSFNGPYKLVQDALRSRRAH